VQGVKEMHDMGIIHQDLKVENILISADGVAKLCDLGSCSTEKI
jgi:protein-serine/threonine kinase